jgi:UDP-N-acetylglucosamine 4,6-dehydratase
MTKALITGGAGFLGRGILRRIERGGLDWEATIYSRDETKQDECQRRYPFARYVLGDVRDADRLRTAMMGHDIVIHAGALKYIPEAEMNAAECVSVNVGGTGAVMRAATEAGIKRVVGISTDKAVQPVNVYGCSKMAMERLFADTAQFQGGPDFVCVRYGNVVGSTGSVIPLFRRQYGELGLVRITNPNMTRFWMSVDEAIDLIVLALERGLPGAIVVPPARAMKIADVARAATVDDVKVEVVGERPGEKLHELLIHYEESVRALTMEAPFHFQLLPPGVKHAPEAFTLASHTPNDWMSIEDMREFVADAEEV